MADPYDGKGKKRITGYGDMLFTHKNLSGPVILDNSRYLEPGRAFYVDYAPAMYELAFTYGWYSDTLSLQRKRLLGISCYTSGTSKYMPISNKYNYKATELFSRILELGDTVDPALKADAAYRMACYYFNTNNVYKKDLDKAEQLLSISQKYARQANDTLLLKAIDAFERARK